MATVDEWDNLVMLADMADLVWKSDNEAKLIPVKKRKFQTPIGGESSSSHFEGENPTKFRRIVFTLSGDNGQKTGDDLPPKKPALLLWLTGTKRRRTSVGKKSPMSPSSTSSPPPPLPPSSPSSSSSGFETDSRKKKKQGSHKVSRAPPSGDGESERAMPDALRDKIAGEGGGEFVLVLEKQLFATDVNKNNNRLSMPSRKLRVSPEAFLREDERMRLTEKAGLAVAVVDEEYREYMLTFKMWTMGPNVVYNLISQWNSVVEKNALRQDDVVQLWAFRRSDNELGFAVVKVNSGR